MRPRHHALALSLGRALIVVLVLTVTMWSVIPSDYVWVIVAAEVWFLSIQAGFSANASELFALGAPTAVMRGTGTGLVLVSAFDAWMNNAMHLEELLVATVLIFVLVLAWQSLFLRLFPRRRRVLIVGNGNTGREIARRIPLYPNPMFELVGFVCDDPLPHANGNGATLGGLDDLTDVIQATRPEIVVISVNKNRPAVFGTLLDNADAGFRIVEDAQFCEHAFGFVPVRDLSRTWFVSVLHLYQQQYSRIAHRAFDLLGAAALVVVVAPLLPFLVVAVKLSRGPLLFKQTRVGQHGVPFTLYKFRTMRENAEEPGQAVWATDRDPRITRSGMVMRRFRLDELPQVWNVIRGDMSIVGPRPERPEFMRMLEENVPFWMRRQLVKPGLTGWAQVCRGYTSDTEGSIEKLSYDLWYIRHRSVFVDFAICLHTVGVVLTGHTIEAPVLTTSRVEDEPQLEVLPPEKIAL